MSLALSPYVVQQEADGGRTVLLNVETGDCFELNRLGTEIVERLRERVEPSEVADQIAEEYSVDLASVRADVEALIEALVRKGLVVATK